MGVIVRDCVKVALGVAVLWGLLIWYLLRCVAPGRTK